MESQSRSPAQDHTVGKGPCQNSRPKSASKAQTLSPVTLLPLIWEAMKGRKGGKKQRREGKQFFRMKCQSSSALNSMDTW